MKRCVVDLTSTRDKIKLQYINECKLHITKKNYDVKLGLNFTFLR